MVRVTEQLAIPEQVTLYYTTDPLLANLPVLIFHGSSTTTNSTLNSSRIQIHVFTAAGFQSFPRITISPNSPLYAGVDHLPRDKQGDEIFRGLAFGLLKYFKELSEVAKNALILHAVNAKTKRPGSAQKLFDEQHAADLAASMVKVENIGEVLQDLEAALRPQNVGYLDVDLVLPPNSIAPFQEPDEDDDMEEDEALDPTLRQYGVYAPLVKLFGELSFLPTSRLRRAPSRPTSMHRTRSFMKDQKLSLRREMAELVDTEERYVMKMHELVNHMADDFRAKAKSRAFGSFSPSEDDLQKLFPQCLDRILAINSAFLAAIRKVMDETEEDAMQDLENPVVGSASSRYGGTGRLKDPTGALAFSKVLLEWFPQFQDCYQEYIRASQEFPQIITNFLRQPSSFSQRVQQTGEQRLRSAVIEPVQRLPRYSLFIDNIVNFLPVLHPALQSMLKARDIITSICSLDPPATDKSQVVNRLKNLVESWPLTLLPQGRLITAVDFIELAAPFDTHQSPGSDSSRQGMFLLFADCFVILKKAKECNLSARGLLAEIDKPSAASIMASVTAAAGGQKHVYDLSLSGWHVLGDTRFTTSDDGRIINLVSSGSLKDTGHGRDRITSSPSIRAFVLQGSYDAKASKLSEEIVKAKIEGRFSEAERETDTWCLRSGRLTDGGLQIYTAVFSEGIDTLKKDRREPAPIRIVVDHEKGTKGAPVGHYGVEIVSNVSVIGAGAKFKLEIDGLNDRVYIDDALVDTFMPIFSKRVTDLLQLQHCPSNPHLSTPFVHFHTKVLKSLQIYSENDKSKSFRPSSPVKILSSFLNSGFNHSTSSFNNSVSAKSSRTPILGSIPTMPSISRTNSNISLHESDGKSSVRTTADETRPMNPLVRLEETFTSYIAALQARKGNVVGRNLRSRGAADELAVNEVYNKFIEIPFDVRTTSETPFDVLFVAFEKFLRMAWKDQMGQVMTVQTLDSLQENALKMYAEDFADYVRAVFGDMAPQNRRAFIAIIKLLADLLDGCGNDGDRGALTASFAELLVVEGEPHNYINLLDRVVEDSDRLFDDIGPGASTNFGGYSNSAYGSVSSAHRSNPSATGSLTSNASSLRRRFADTLLRSNSSNKDRPSMWRTLSKTDRHVATGEPLTPSSLSKVSLNRSRSIESPNRRPASRDRPTILGAFEERPPSSHTPQPKLTTISASPPPEETQRSGKKKRRSSLSDLKSMMAAATLATDSPLSPSPENKPRTILRYNSPRTPITPSPTRIPVTNGGGVLDRSKSLHRLSSPDTKQKENNTPIVTPPPRDSGGLTERPQNIPSLAPAADIVAKEAWRPGHSKTVSLSSNIPTLTTLRSRTNSVVRPTTSTGISYKSGTPGRLRLQSPQKLRERLKDEAKAISAAEESLQTELSKIGEEMARLNNGGSSSSPSSLQKACTQLKSIESRIPILVSDLTSRNEALKQDMERSIEGLETKVKGLDQLHRESSAENELLYEKFNGELGKIVKALKGKGKEDKEELISKMKEASEEAAKTKKENARLRREIVTLRTLLKAAE
ncbi:RhoGEF domain-containing protein [Phlyctema vagabunda]|uniref:RhoGEF domain-containing protein n=1 Tax=Phlyctema vagabunda TaxID=108571 RepID=A0ABR4P9T7_9HELO